MTEAESQTRGITDERKRWVQVELAKVNYGPPLESRWLYRGDGGVLTGSTQPPKPQAKQASGKATGKGDGGAAYAAASGSFSPYVDPRRRPRHHVADDIDLQIPGEL
jgi:hypothetical protein